MERNTGPRNNRPLPNRLTPVLLVVISILAAAKCTPGVITEYCHKEEFNATCAQDHVIIIETAEYGRMRLGRCVKHNLGYLGCKADARIFLDAHCSGRRQCQVPVLEVARAMSTKCSDDVTLYLEASYRCARVVTSHQTQCHTHHFVRVPPSGGLLASTQALEQGTGSSNCPWIIEAKPGQHINLTLWNFARAELVDGATGLATDPCYEFASIKDGNSRRNIIGCANNRRTSEALISSSNVVEVNVADRIVQSKTIHFLLEYSIAGCMGPVPPTGAWMKVIDDNTVRMTCNRSEEAWNMTCTDGKWVGKAANCTADNSWGSSGLFTTDSSFPYGILVVVAVGVALGVFFGGLLLFLVNLVLRNRRSQKHESSDVLSVDEYEAKYHQQLPPDYGTGSMRQIQPKSRDVPIPQAPIAAPVHGPEGGGYIVDSATLHRMKRMDPYSPHHTCVPGQTQTKHYYESPHFS